MGDNGYMILGKQRFDMSQVDVQTAALNKALDEMAEKTKQTFLKMGQHTSAAAVTELNKMVTEVNNQAKQMGSSLSGAMVEATKSTKTFTASTGKIKETLEGINVLGRKVRHTLETVNGATTLTKTSETIVSPDVVKQTQAAANNMAKALRQYDAALKDGRATAAAYWQSNIEQQKELLTYYHNLAAEEGIAGESRKRVAEITAQAALEEEKYTKKINDRIAAQKKRDTEDATAKMEVSSLNAVRETEDAYRRLLKSQSEYVSALKAGNVSRQAYWQAEIDGSKETLSVISTVASKMNIAEDAKSRIKQITNDAAQAESKHADIIHETKKRMDEQRKSAELAEQNIRNVVQEMEQWLATMILMRGMSSLWNNMTGYAAEYYDAMNEIRIVTGITIEEADKLGQTYRQMAQEMSVSSTEIASAAVEYWRQGLDEREVNERLKYTTAYAKISALDFKTAAELMTAATNAMGISAERVADVWSYLGDASASG